MPLTKIVLALLFVGVGCQTQTVEYRSRPSWQTALSNGLPSEQVREDGTVMKYSSANEHSGQALQEYLNSIKLEETDEVTGELTLRAILPDHVLKHLLTCLRDRSWNLIYEQLISSTMKQYYSQLEDRREKFDSFFISNRRELAKALQQIRGGMGFGDVFTSENGKEIIYTLSSRIASDYKFKSISFIRENEFLKLHSIE